MSWAALVYGELKLSAENEAAWRSLEVDTAEWSDWPQDLDPGGPERFQVGALLETLASYADDAWVRFERSEDGLLVFGKLHEDAYHDFSTRLIAALRAAQRVGARGDVHVSDFAMSDFVWRVRLGPKGSTVREADFERAASTILPKALDRLTADGARGSSGAAKAAVPAARARSPIDFGAERLVVRYRASPEPQRLTIHFTFKKPSNGSPNSLHMICHHVNAGLAGSDVFAPLAGAAAVPLPNFMRDGQIALDEYEVVLEGIRAVAPIFMRQVVGLVWSASGPIGLASLAITGELPTDESDASVTEDDVRRWLDDPTAYPRRWTAPSFPVEEAHVGAAGVAAIIELASAPSDAQKAELQTRILSWKNQVATYTSPEGFVVPHDPAARAKIRFKKMEARLDVERLENTRRLSMDLLVNVLERAHHEVLGIRRLTLTT